MIIIEKNRSSNGILLKGDFFDLDRLYFAIQKYTGFHGFNNSCIYPGYYDVCENLLGLCYEIRHGWEGKRDLAQVYNGVHKEWFDDYKDSFSDDSDEDEDFDDELFDEDEEESEDEDLYAFSRKDFPDITEQNAYFSIPIPFPEAIFYTLILIELLDKKEIFMNARKALIKADESMEELNKQYYYFQAEEDIARITLFVKQTLHTLYRFIGEKRYSHFMGQFASYNNFFLKCDLDRLNEIMGEYGEKEYEKDDPEYLYQVLMSFFN